MKSLIWKLAALFGLILLLGSSLAGDVSVFAAASLTEALKEIETEYERDTGDKVRLNFGASSTLARQIIEGAPADIFFSADEEKMDQLEKNGLVRKGTRVSLLSNSLVVVVTQDSELKIDSPENLTRLKRLALAETRTVPAGIYAREWLEKSGVWESVEKRVVPTENVRAALAAVESGNVEAAIVYQTDAAMSRQVKVAFAVPRETGPKISYPVAVLREARNVSGGEKFLMHLQSPKAKNVFRQHGFLVLKD